MKPVYQTQFLGRVGPGAGNCHAAATASLLELPLDAVPNFMEIEDDDERYEKELAWLHDLGFVSMCFEEGGEGVEGHWYGWHLAVGPNTRNGTMHTCVYYGNELQHDPHPEGGGLAEVQYRWLLVPLEPKITEAVR